MGLFHAFLEYACTGQFWLLLLLGALVIRYIRSLRYNLPPRPHGWPIIGNALFIPKHETYRWFKEVAKEFGPVYRVSFGIDSVIINDAKTAHEALVDRAKDFSGRANAMLFEVVSENYQDVAFSDPDVHMWPQRRKLLAVALRNFTNGRDYEERVFKTVGELMKSLDEKADTGEAFNPSKFCKFFTHNQVGGMCFSRTCTMNDAKFVKLIDHFDQFNRLLGNFQISDFLPFSKYLPFDLPDRRRTKKAVSYITKFAEEEIQKHKDTFTGKETSDLTYYIMKMMAEDDTLAQITDVEQRQLILDVFGAGVDTTQMQFRWLLGCLAEHQNLQDKIYEEILETIGPIDKDDKNFGISCADYKAKMPYSEAFLLETTRFGTVSIVSLPRKTLCDTKIGEYDIPKGTTVFVNQWAINYNERENENPEEFRPERFLTEEGVLGPRPDSYMPFGLGRRACPGETAARNTLWMTMIMLLRRYKVLPPEGQKFKVEYGPSIILGGPKDYEITLQYRSHTEVD